MEILSVVLLDLLAQVLSLHLLTHVVQWLHPHDALLNSWQLVLPSMSSLGSLWLLISDVDVEDAAKDPKVDFSTSGKDDNIDGVQERSSKNEWWIIFFFSTGTTSSGLY